MMQDSSSALTDTQLKLGRNRACYQLNQMLLGDSGKVRLSYAALPVAVLLTVIVSSLA